MALVTIQIDLPEQQIAALLRAPVKPIKHTKARKPIKARKTTADVSKDAPYGLKADGTPKKRPGRPRKA